MRERFDEAHAACRDYCGEASFEIPGDLPAGYHRLGCRTADGTVEATLIVTSVGSASRLAAMLGTALTSKNPAEYQHEEPE